MSACACGLANLTAQELNAHKILTGCSLIGPPKYYKCAKCDKIYASLEKVANHYCQDIIWRSEITKNMHLYRCIACNINFSSRDRMRVHMQGMHYKYRCEFCGRTFASSGFLAQHEARYHVYPDNPRSILEIEYKKLEAKYEELKNKYEELLSEVRENEYDLDTKLKFALMTGEFSLHR